MMAGSSSGLVSITIMITMTMAMTITVARSLVVRAGILQRSHSAVGAVAEVGNVAAYLSVYIYIYIYTYIHSTYHRLLAAWGGEYLKRKVPESKRGSICDESLVGADEPVTPNERVVTKASGRSAGRCEAAGTAAR